MKKTVLSLTMLAIIAPMSFSGCATIFGKSSYPVSINSNPSGATVSITDKKGKEVYKGQTPATVTLKSGAGYFSRAEYQVRISKTGYEEQIIPVNFKLNAWYFGNILIGGFLGMLIIDPVTGAMWKLETPPINVTLNKSTASTETPTLNIIDIASVPQYMKQYLVRIK
ncbi:MAG: PEGA domain-containing protein [Acidobacterium ailaaui]|nr:PEGA domain-containing protein [Pseudacidobacterium ailaaui]